MKRKNDSIQPSCALCKHAVFLPSENAPNIPPLLLSLKANGMDEDISISCPHKKDASPAYSCRRFSFDPLKYRPQKTPKISALDEDTLLID